MKFQETFVQSVLLYFGSEGEKWLNNLPKLISFCEEKWSLTFREPYLLSVNYVAPAIREDGTEVVVKICLLGEGFANEL